MLASHAAPFDSNDYLFEIKWDGIRALAFFGPGLARIQGRKLTDTSARYPELVAALENLTGEGVLDGEVVVLDDDGRPDFQQVLSREQTTDRSAALLKARKHPVAYMAFDLIHRNGSPLYDTPLIERKKLLSELLGAAPSAIVESAYVIGKGRAFFEQAKARRLEGVVAKRLSSHYIPGQRTRDWLKLKVRRQMDAVVLATVRERGTRRVRSLVLGAYRNGRLDWIGNVGSGLDQRTVAELGTMLGPLAGPPMPQLAVVAPGKLEWLRPALVARVEFSELTNDGRLRHPSFIGFVKRKPEECVAPER
jgi:DNA ligase D-like protein (predicted ligase)